MKAIQRSAGCSAIAAAAYRAGERLFDKRTGETKNYTRRNGVEVTEIIGWSGSREKLWNEAEAAEKRKDAVVAREVQIALPHELTDTQRLKLVRSICRDLQGRFGVAVDFAIHAPSASGDQRNYHTHILITARAVDHDGKFSAKKYRDLNKGSETVVALRRDIEQKINRALEHAGSRERVDVRSVMDRVRAGEEAPGVEVGKGKVGPVVTSIKRRVLAGKQAAPAWLHSEIHAEIVRHRTNKILRKAWNKSKRPMNRRLNALGHGWRAIAGMFRAGMERQQLDNQVEHEMMHLVLVVVKAPMRFIRGFKQGMLIGAGKISLVPSKNPSAKTKVVVRASDINDNKTFDDSQVTQKPTITEMVPGQNRYQTLAKQSSGNSTHQNPPRKRRRRDQKSRMR